MPDKAKKPAGKEPEKAAKKPEEAVGGEPAGKEEFVSLEEGRYGASWFVTIAGLILVGYFFVALAINNYIILKAVVDNQDGASMWASTLAFWMESNISYITFGSIIFIIGYSLTLKKKGTFERGNMLLKLFGVCAGFVAVAFFVLDLLYTFVLPKEELVGFSANLQFYGMQIAQIAAWCSILGAITVYCWLPKKAGAVPEEKKSSLPAGKASAKEGQGV